MLKTLIADRKAKRITQTDVANYIGISKSMLCLIESDKSSPNLKYIEKYAECLGFEIRLIKK